MRPLLDRAECRAEDKRAMDVGVPGIVLMENAARGATDVLVARFAKHLMHVLVIGGEGQNGGDAWALARHLKTRGFKPTVLLVGAMERVQGDALIALTALRAVDVMVVVARTKADIEAALMHATCVVDGLFGTGLTRPLEGLALDAVQAINARALPTLALDLPSGVCASTGQLFTDAVHADVTVTFHAEKLGLAQFPGTECAGEVVLADIGVPPPQHATVWLRDAAWLSESLTARPRDAHKGTGGHVFVVGGSPGKTGAALLSARGALRGGAGLVTIAARGGTRAALDAKVIELMTREVPEALEAGVRTVLEDAKKASAFVVGPGLGTDEATQTFTRRIALEVTTPMVLDADALAPFSGAQLTQLQRAQGPRVLTPHPGEAARLLGIDTDDVQRDRYSVCAELALRSGHIVVLKGARTIVQGPNTHAYVCAEGTPALGVAGTGDVLAGVIAAALASKDSTAKSRIDSVCEAVLAHALAGARAAEGRDRGLFASEVADAVSHVLAPRIRTF
jgi:NAD(P)H-hydrate epimerase